MKQNGPLGDAEAALAAFEHGPGLAAAFAGPDCEIVAVNAAARELVGGR